MDSSTQHLLPDDSDAPAFETSMELRNIEEQYHVNIFIAKERRTAKFKNAFGRRSWDTTFSGWRGGALVSTTICALVLAVNILLTIVAKIAWNPKEGIATAYTGDCTVAARQLTVAHLFINALSSLLLGASNYCMQRLVAPTRAEIDTAHARWIALDIGIPSVKNLLHISPSRALLWVILGLSSVPLHLIYNSVIFGTISANVASFVYTDSPKTMRALEHDMWNPNLFTNVTSTECNGRYSAQLFTNYGSGWGVLDTTSTDVTRRFGNATNHTWSPTVSGIGNFQLGNDYLYCLSENVPPACQVQLSLTIMGIVIFANVVKVLVIIIMILYLDHQTIVTVGDAIQSFLRSPDLTTRNNCLLSRSNIRNQWSLAKVPSTQHWRQKFGPYWHTACSRRRWIISLLFALSALIPATVIVVISQLRRVSLLGKTWNSFGRVSTQHLLNIELTHGEESIIPAVLFVNSPQVVVSFLYLLFNGLFTCMLAGGEWSRYAVKRAMLRVTVPTLNQRSTHFLQLPYTWSVPLLIISILLHWAISQSVFLARVAFYKDGKPTEINFSMMQERWERHIQDYANVTYILPQHITTQSKARYGKAFNGIGYSDIGLLTSLGLVLALMMSCRLIAGFQTYDKGLPTGGTNSAVISAACHVKYEHGEQGKDEVDIAERPLKWGVTVEPGPDGVGHLCFSDQEVGQPEFDCLYAGTGRASDRKL